MHGQPDSLTVVRDHVDVVCRLVSSCGREQGRRGGGGAGRMVTGL